MDLLLQWKAWETQAFGSVFGVALSAIDLLYVPAEEFIDAFLDSWHSAYDEDPDTCQLCLRRIVVCTVR